MSARIDQLVQSLLQKQSLDQCGIRELQQLSEEYPFFNAFQFLLVKKLSFAQQDESYRDQFQRALVFFQHPLWLENLMSESSHDATIQDKVADFSTSSSSNKDIPQNFETGLTEKKEEHTYKPEIHQSIVENESNAETSFQSVESPIVQSEEIIAAGEAHQQVSVLSDDPGPEGQIASIAEKENELIEEVNSVAHEEGLSTSPTEEDMKLSSPELTQVAQAEQTEMNEIEVAGLEEDGINEHQEYSQEQQEEAGKQIAGIEAKEIELVEEVNEVSGGPPILPTEVETMSTGLPVTEHDNAESQNEKLINIDLVDDSLNDSPVVEPAITGSSDEDSHVNNTTNEIIGQSASREEVPAYDQSDDPDGTGPERDEQSFPPIPPLKIEAMDPEKAELHFEPYHTVDYFASQGIKFVNEDGPKDKFGKQLKSFTEWLKAMKRLPASRIAETVDEPTVKKVEQLAEHSIEDREVITEAMAEVWEKQGNMTKAIEVYDKLSLLDPSKSRYFAAKIELLKKTN